MIRTQAVEGTILPASELEIQNAIWAAQEALDRPIVTRDIYTYGTEYIQRLKMTTILTLISRLLSKHFLRIEDPASCFGCKKSERA